MVLLIGDNYNVISNTNYVLNGVELMSELRDVELISLRDQEFKIKFEDTHYVIFYTLPDDKVILNLTRHDIVLGDEEIHPQFGPIAQFLCDAIKYYLPSDKKQEIWGIPVYNQRFMDLPALTRFIEWTADYAHHVILPYALFSELIWITDTKRYNDLQFVTYSEYKNRRGNTYGCSVISKFRTFNDEAL